MRILHILSQFQVTGAEVYAATLANQQVKEGHQVTIMSDTWHTATIATFVPQSIGVRTLKQKWKNVWAIRRFVLNQQIEVVHAHSRAASWVSFFALKGLKVPLVSQVHGRQHLHASSKGLDIYGDRILAVCDNLSTHLRLELGIDRTKIFVSPNGFDWRKLLHLTQPDDYEEFHGKTIVLAGRTSGPKGQHTGHLVSHTVPAILKLVPYKWRLVVIGGPLEDMTSEVQSIWNALVERYPDRFLWIGFSRQLPNWLSVADVVIGSGRVAIEALGLGKPMIAMGEWCTHGLITDKNIDIAVASNFGDIGAKMPHPGIDWGWLQQDLTAVLLQENPAKPNEASIQRIRDVYAIDDVLSAVMEHYYSARAKKLQPREIPILMYHKVLLEPSNSKHRIFVTVDTFKAHLSHIRKEGLTPINFKQYEAWKKGELPQTWMPKRPIILTFDDGYLDNYTNAWPLLKQYGYTAVIYALGDPDLDHNKWDVEKGEPREPLMSIDQKREMANAGIEFGAHTMRHLDLTTVSAKALHYELNEAKSQLEHDLGHDVISFAYPYGSINPSVEHQTRKAGYKYAVVINEHAGIHLEDNPMAIFRAYIFPEDLGSRFSKKTSWWYRRYFKWKRGR